MTKKGNKILKFDVMLNGRFVHSFKYEYCPLFPIDSEELKAFVLKKMPTLKNKDFRIEF